MTTILGEIVNIKTDMIQVMNSCQSVMNSFQSIYDRLSTLELAIGSRKRQRTTAASNSVVSSEKDRQTAPPAPKSAKLDKNVRDQAVNNAATVVKVEPSSPSTSQPVSSHASIQTLVQKTKEKPASASTETPANDRSPTTGDEKQSGNVEMESNVIRSVPPTSPLNPWWLKRWPTVRTKPTASSTSEGSVADGTTNNTPTPCPSETWESTSTEVSRPVLVKKIFIKGIKDTALTPDDVKEYFLQFGHIVDCGVSGLNKDESGNPRAFVEFEDHDAVEIIMSQSSIHKIKDVTVEVQKADNDGVDPSPSSLAAENKENKDGFEEKGDEKGDKHSGLLRTPSSASSMKGGDFRMKDDGMGGGTTRYGGAREPCQELMGLGQNYGSDFGGGPMRARGRGRGKLGPRGNRATFRGSGPVSAGFRDGGHTHRGGPMGPRFGGGPMGPGFGGGPMGPRFGGPMGQGFGGGPMGPGFGGGPMGPGFIGGPQGPGIGEGPMGIGFGGGPMGPGCRGGPMGPGCGGGRW